MKRRTDVFAAYVGSTFTSGSRPTRPFRGGHGCVMAVQALTDAQGEVRSVNADLFNRKIVSFAVVPLVEVGEAGGRTGLIRSRKRSNRSGLAECGAANDNRKKQRDKTSESKALHILTLVSVMHAGCRLALAALDGEP